MKFQFSLPEDAGALLPHKNSILELFRKCFQRELDPVMWDWAYTGNSSGNPIVSLCHLEGKLVGHYAVIPFPLMQGNSEVRACLSMTTMVDSAYRKYGLFVEQAEQVYERAQAMDYGIVFGFPNKNSTPGFRKRLGWAIDEPDYVASVTVKQLADSPEFLDSLKDQSLVRLAIENGAFMKWRLSKPHRVYHKSFPFITKEFDSQEEIVAIQGLPAHFDSSGQRYKIMVDASVTDLRAHEIFPYQFGFRPLNARYLDLKFKKDLLLSDVF